MNWPDAAGMVGVVLILAGYAGVQLRKLDAIKAPALVINLAGSSLIALSLVFQFNLSAFLIEVAWAVLSAFGLARLALRR